MIYDIRVGDYKLGLLESVEIHKSVDLLADTAVIVLPGVVYNQSLDVEHMIHIGDRVSIKLGYDEELREEFSGYLQRIDTDDSSLTLSCEDECYQLRKPVANKQFAKTSMQDIASYCLSEIGLSKMNCTYSIGYDKFVIMNANAFDVMLKLQDETKANIYMIGDTLHIHPPYVEKGGDVSYDFAVNVEKSELKYRRSDDRKYEVHVVGVGLDGKKQQATVGVTGGEKRTIHISSPMDMQSMLKRAEAELSYLSYDGYEGSITGWLIPYVEPTYSAHLHDAEYEYKNGSYYVVSVTTKFSDQGASRKVQLGRKLTGNG